MAAAIQPNAIPDPDAKTTAWLYKAAVTGLFGIAVLALIGAIVLIVLKDNPSTVVTIGTAALTGVIGMFVPSPAKS